MITKTVLGSIAAVLVASSAFAQPAEIQERVKDGQKVSVTDSQGRQFSGRVSEKTAGGLTIIKGRQRAEIPYDQITSIDRPKDRLWNGALYGALIGAGLGLVTPSETEIEGCDPALFTDCSTDATGLSVIGGSVVGALLGAGVDALIRRDRNIYRRPGTTRIGVSPHYGRRAGGLMVSVAW